MAFTKSESLTCAAESVLHDWNVLGSSQAVAEILPCCGSKAWADAIVALRPFRNTAALMLAADDVWKSLPEADWQEAFDSHPRIGEHTPSGGSAKLVALKWSHAEQSSAMLARNKEKIALLEANRRYENRFGRIFIISASGRAACEVLKEVERRLHNPPALELLEAAQQQAEITKLRLRRWLAGT